MTESEKAQLGQLYNANHDPQLLNRRTWAKNLCMDYNQLRWDEGVKRTALLQELLGICGEDAVIEPPFFVDYGKNICIGRSFYANHNLVILDGRDRHHRQQRVHRAELHDLDRRSSL